MQAISILFFVFFLLVSGCARNNEGGPFSFLDFDRDIEPRELNPLDPEKSFDFSATFADANNICHGPIRISGDQTRFASEIDRFMHAAYCAYYYSALTPDSPVVKKDEFRRHYVKLYIDYGISLSDELCDDWLNTLEVKRTRTEFIQNNVGVGAQATAAIMALTQASKTSIGVVTILGTAVTSGFENYKENFILTPNLQILKKQVSSLRDQKKALINEDNISEFTYTDAEQTLDAYDAICSRKFVVDLLNTSLKEIKYTFSIPDFSDERAIVSSVDEAKTLIKTEQFQPVNVLTPEEEAARLTR